MDAEKGKKDHCGWNGFDHWGHKVTPTQSFARGTLGHGEFFDAYIVPLSDQGSVLWLFVVDVRWDQKELRGVKPAEHAGQTVHHPYCWIIECRDADAAHSYAMAMLRERFFIKECERTL